MKTKVLFKLSLMVLIILIPVRHFAQSKPTIAIVSIDSKGVLLDNAAMASLVRLELEKLNIFEVKDKYDVSNAITENNIDLNNCFGKKKMVEVGKILAVNKMLTGSAEKFGEKIILILRLVDIETEKFEKTEVTEYLDQQSEMQTMVKISLNNLFGIPNDQNLVNLLIHYDRPITSAKTTVRLNGPRMGIGWTTGKNGGRLQAPTNEGGYNMFPMTSLFGYQLEKQYLSSGDFQALIEFIPAINGLESGNFSPSITFMNGFRFNRSGFEFGIGPVFRVVKMANGYYDENKKWHLEGDAYGENLYPIETQIDSRGEPELSTGLILAIGRTFKSGYLNIPLNLYVSPKKEGTTFGLTIGFNVAKTPKLK